MTTTLLEGSYPLAERAEARRPVALIAVSAAPIVLGDRYRLLVAAVVRLHRSRRSQWTLAVASGAVVIVLALLAVRHFAGVRAGLAVVAVAGVAAAVLIVALPRLVASRRTLRFRLGAG